MESSGSSVNSSDQRPHRWAEIWGTVIAVLTLTMPVLVIAHFSSSSVELLPPATYSVSRPEK